MRLSDARIRALSRSIAKEMIARGVVEMKAPEHTLADLITRVFQEDQDLDSVLDAEARAAVARQKSLPPPGSGEYQAAFAREKKAAAAKRGLKEW
ncbi:DUF507 family protein [Candidatus Sumerlaeota bacterium]|nr:DUF507 family protein [Candidatus Sumerlaeota bacterium]